MFSLRQYPQPYPTMEISMQRPCVRNWIWQTVMGYASHEEVGSYKRQRTTPVADQRYQ
jgi:hypothetical protein